MLNIEEQTFCSHNFNKNAVARLEEARKQIPVRHHELNVVGCCRKMRKNRECTQRQSHREHTTILISTVSNAHHFFRRQKNTERHSILQIY